MIKIAVCIASTGHCKTQFAVSLSSLMAYFPSKRLAEEEPDQYIGQFLVESSGLAQNQHQLVTRAKEWGATHILWLEDYMQFPADALHRLFAWRQKWVGANYPIRTWPPVAGNTAVGLNGKRLETKAASKGLVMQALQAIIVAEKHGPGRRGATGVSVYFPNSRLYGAPAAGAESYTAVANRFASQSTWDDFLPFHYTGRSFEPAAAVPVVPGREATITAPGAGAIQISGLALSAPEAAPGSPITISADIGGENVGYIKLFVGYLDPASNSIYVADTDYLESAEMREVDGVFYPDWGEGDFTLEFEWEPIVFAVSDGSELAEAVFEPESYGAVPEEAEYAVDGTYTYADGETRPARLHFVNRVFTQVFGFANQDGTGAPREIIPTTGDRFRRRSKRE